MWIMLLLRLGLVKEGTWASRWNLTLVVFRYIADLGRKQYIEEQFCCSIKMYMFQKYCMFRYLSKQSTLGLIERSDDLHILPPNFQNQISSFKTKIVVQFGFLSLPPLLDTTCQENFSPTYAWAFIVWLVRCLWACVFMLTALTLYFVSPTLFQK